MQRALRLTVILSFAGAATALAFSPAVATAADAPAGAAKPLGDLNAFITIAKDGQKIAKGGDYAKARALVKDLEKTWDDGEDNFRPNNPDAWRDTDRKLDKALDKLRDMKPDAAAVNGALDTLVATLESLNKPK